MIKIHNTVIVVCLLFLFAMIGCATQSIVLQPKAANDVINDDEIYAAVNVYPINGATICDSKYTLVTKEWVQSKFTSDLSNRLLDKVYISESFDCDAFTLYGKQVAIEEAWKSGTKLAIGEFYYIRDADARAHAINFFLYKSANSVKVGFIEPQTREIISLSQKEIESCIHWRI